MRLGIMQPYFLPYLGYFSIIASTDKWIFFDTPQYIRKGWVNRNRVLKKGGGWKYIRIPVQKHPRYTPINEILVKNDSDWKDQLIADLDYYKEVRAKNYPEIRDFLISILDEKELSLPQILINSTVHICNYLGLQINYSVYSTSALSVEEKVTGPGDWAFHISKDLGADHYINPSGGKEIFDRDQFRSGGIELSFIHNNLSKYDQCSNDFIPGLSIIDSMMFLDKDAVLEKINEYKLESY